MVAPVARQTYVAKLTSPSKPQSSHFPQMTPLSMAIP